MIGKVAYKVVTGTGAADTRSDDECDEDEEGEEDEGQEFTVEEDELKVKEETTKILRRADSGYISGSTGGTSALSSLIMNGNGGHSGSTHRHISSKLNAGDMH